MSENDDMAQREAALAEERLAEIWTRYVMALLKTDAATVAELEATFAQPEPAWAPHLRARVADLLPTTDTQRGVHHPTAQVSGFTSFFKRAKRVALEA